MKAHITVKRIKATKSYLNSDSVVLPDFYFEFEQPAFNYMVAHVQEGLLTNKAKHRIRLLLDGEGPYQIEGSTHIYVRLEWAELGPKR